MSGQCPQKVIFRSGTRKVRAIYFAGETLLDTARRAGVPIPTSCEAGDCGTCIMELVRGEVAMANHSALSDDDIASNQILACQGIPTSEHCVVQIP